MSGSEHRRFPRVSFRVPCDVCVNADLKGIGFIVDASAGGLLLQTQLCVEVGDRVVVQIRDDDSSVCKVDGKITRHVRSHRDAHAVVQPTLAVEIEGANEAFYQLIMRRSGQAS